jgi:hypothetical protein
MADQQTANGKDKDYDPMSAFREMRDQYLDAWGKVMIETVNTDSYARATGAMLDSYLTASTPFREALEKVMLQALQQMSMPSRADFCSLAERATHIEMKLDDMDARLERIEKLIVGARATATKAPARTQRARRSRKGAK